MVFALHPDEQIGAIRRLGHREQLAINPLLMPRLNACDEGVDRVAGFLRFEHLEFAAATGRHKVIETNPLDFLGFDEIEDLLDVLDVVAGEGQSQAGLLLHVVAVFETADGGIKRAFLAAEFVVNLADAIERDADVGDVGCLQQRGLFRGDQRAVGGNGELQAGVGGEVHQVEKPRVNHRFATREQQRRHLVGSEIGDDRLHLVPVEFTRILDGVGVRVAVDAAQVAGAGDVPDDDWLASAGVGFGTGAVTVAKSIGRLRLAGP